MDEQTKQRRIRSNVVMSNRYSAEDMDYSRKPKEVDALTKAQNVKAASILLDKLYEQEVTRNTPDVIKGYVDSKNGKFVDTTTTGRTPIDNTPPPDWPFSGHEWTQATQFGPFNLLSKVSGYLIHEQERQHRKHTTLYNVGVSGVDSEQVERLHKTKEKQRKVNQRNWRNRMKQPIELGPNPASPVPYVSSSDPYATVAHDMVTGSDYATLFDAAMSNLIDD